MASEFPRGWRFIVEAVGGAPATATITGLPGISHVLTDVHVEISDGAAGGTALALTVSLNSQLISLTLFTNPGKDTSDINFPFNGGPGNSLVFTFQATALASTTMVVILQGYDI